MWYLCKYTLKYNTRIFDNKVYFIYIIDLYKMMIGLMIKLNIYNLEAIKSFNNISTNTVYKRILLLNLNIKQKLASTIDNH